MKLLLTADLHFRLHWFRWLVEQAPDFDLICIAGDLLDMFRSETRMEQAREVRTLIRELADIVPVALCSGNHDNAGRLVSHDRASVYEWFIELGTPSEHHHRWFNAKAGEPDSDDDSLPMLPARKDNLARSRSYDSQTNRMPWIVLHHVPAKKRCGRQRRRSEASELLASRLHVGMTELNK